MEVNLDNVLFITHCYYKNLFDVERLTAQLNKFYPHSPVYIIGDGIDRLPKIYNHQHIFLPGKRLKTAEYNTLWTKRYMDVAAASTKEWICKIEPDCHLFRRLKDFEIPSNTNMVAKISKSYISDNIKYVFTNGGIRFFRRELAQSLLVSRLLDKNLITEKPSICKYLHKDTHEEHMNDDGVLGYCFSILGLNGECIFDHPEIYSYYEKPISENPENKYAFICPFISN